MREGLVISLRYGVYVVKVDDQYISCSQRGTLKKEKRSPVVGDRVIVNLEENVIEDVKERKNILKRPSIANLDQMFVVFSLKEPEFSFHLAFKYLTYANKYHVKTILILTKSDKDVSVNETKEIVDIFNKLNIDTYVVSNKTKEGLDKVTPLFKDKISCLVGQSGVGKSSLLNAIDSSYKRGEGEYSVSLGRGKHETKETILLPYQNGYIADTPGFSSLDLELYKEDLAKYFPGFTNLYEECYFNDCLHISEKHCRVKEEIEKGNIPQIAYQEYLKLSMEVIPFIKRYEV